MGGNYSVHYEILDDVPVLYIVGDMTSDADNAVVSVFNELRKKKHSDKVIFNFKDTNYINSAGLATLINIIQEMEKSNGVVAFAGLTTHFQKVMDIVGITEFINIYETNEEAIGAI
jgi:anti-anti-sigma factor